MQNNIQLLSRRLPVSYDFIARIRVSTVMERYWCSAKFKYHWWAKERSSSCTLLSYPEKHKKANKQTNHKNTPTTKTKALKGGVWRMEKAAQYSAGAAGLLFPFTDGSRVTGCSCGGCFFYDVLPPNSGDWFLGFIVYSWSDQGSQYLHLRLKISFKLTLEH